MSIVVCWFQQTLKQLEREQTDTQDNYSNPRACAPRVKYLVNGNTANFQKQNTSILLLQTSNKNQAKKGVTPFQKYEGFCRRTGNSQVAESNQTVYSGLLKKRVRPKIDAMSATTKTRTRTVLMFTFSCVALGLHMSAWHCT